MTTPKTSQVLSLAVATGKPAALYLSGPEGADQVVVLDVKTCGTTTLKLGASGTGAARSTDGSKVAFCYRDAQGPALGVLDLDRRQGLTPDGSRFVLELFGAAA